jgi:hypothetical protein
MAGCTNELYNLIPTVDTCPGSNELVLFMNVAGQPGGYAARPWSLVRQCLLNQGLVVVPFQFVVGQTGSPLAAGETQFVVNQSNIIQDSVTLILGGVVLDRDDDTQISYLVSYASGSMMITLNQAAQANQIYILIYSYVQ